MDLETALTSFLLSSWCVFSSSFFFELSCVCYQKGCCYLYQQTPISYVCLLEVFSSGEKSEEEHDGEMGKVECWIVGGCGVVEFVEFVEGELCEMKNFVKFCQKIQKL